MVILAWLEAWVQQVRHYDGTRSQEKPIYPDANQFLRKMKNERQKREEEIFWSALKIKSPGERALLLKCKCQGDAQLRKRVDMLLAINAEAQAFFQTLDVATMLTEAASDILKNPVRHDCKNCG